MIRSTKATQRTIEPRNEDDIDDEILMHMEKVSLETEKLDADFVKNDAEVEEVPEINYKLSDLKKILRLYLKYHDLLKRKQYLRIEKEKLIDEIKEHRHEKKQQKRIEGTEEQKCDRRTKSSVPFSSEEPNDVKLQVEKQKDYFLEIKERVKTKIMETKNEFEKLVKKHQTSNADVRRMEYLFNEQSYLLKQKQKIKEREKQWRCECRELFL